MKARNVGDKVFDMPSQAIRMITKVERERYDGRLQTFYTVDAPDNPTGDGAFPSGVRNVFEVCAPDKTMPLRY